MDLLWKVCGSILVGTFIVSGWVSSIGQLQKTSDAHGSEIKAIKEDVKAQERKYIDVLGRIDERLKNIENKR